MSFINNTPSDDLCLDIKRHRLIGSFIVKEVFVQYSVLWQVMIYSFKKVDFKPVIINQSINFAGSRFQANNSFRKSEKFTLSV